MKSYWIKVSDCLPEQDEKVLICDKQGMISIGYYFTSDIGEGDFITWNASDDYMNVKVLYWMPLPTAPNL